MLFFFSESYYCQRAEILRDFLFNLKLDFNAGILKSCLNMEKKIIAIISDTCAFLKTLFRLTKKSLVYPEEDKQKRSCLFQH